MAVLNVTPDSFSDGGVHDEPDVAVAEALRMAESGADILDIGGESTRPGAPPVTADEEWRRVEPVLARLQGRLSIPISIDTYKAVVAERALALGAVIVNDVSALVYEPALASVVAERGAPIVLMHNRGRSSRMYERAEYWDVVVDVRSELQARIDAAVRAGIARERIVIDPGVGFAKRAGQSLEVLARLAEFADLDRPILVGPSRKSFLQAAIGDVPPAERRWGTAAAVAAAVFWGAHVVRVHDLPAMRDVVRVADALRASARRVGQ